MSFIFKKNRHKRKKNFGNFTNFFKVGIGEGVVFLYFKQLLPSKVCAILYLLKERVSNPHPLKKFSQNIIKF